MSNSKPNYFQRRTKPQGPRANERIKALDVQVIGSEGNNLGTMPLNKAIELAKQEDLDLIEISPNSQLAELAIFFANSGLLLPLNILRSLFI